MDTGATVEAQMFRREISALHWKKWFAHIGMGKRNFANVTTLTKAA